MSTRQALAAVTAAALLIWSADPAAALATRPASCV